MWMSRVAWNNKLGKEADQLLSLAILTPLCSAEGMIAALENIA